MKKYPLVAITLPVHNNKKDTRDFLECLKSVTYPNYKVIIVDDGSTDGTEEMLRQEYPEVIIVKGDGNLWGTLSMNIGIEKAIEIGADYVLWTNNDLVVDANFLSVLVDTAERNPRSIPFSKVYCYDDPKRIYCAGWEVNWLRGGLRRIGVRELDREQYDVQYDSKAANLNMLVNTAFFQDLGMLDYKSFPQYWSDTDFTYRAYKKGYRIIYEPKSIIWNKGQGTIRSGMPQTASPLTALAYFAGNRRSPHNLRDSTIFFWKHCPKPLLPFPLARNAISIILPSLAMCGRHIIRQLQLRMGKAGNR